MVRLCFCYDADPLVHAPQSLKEIKKKVNNGTYPNTDAFASDIYLMLQNAMTYVRPFCSLPAVTAADTDHCRLARLAERRWQREFSPTLASLPSHALIVASPPQIVFQDARLLRETFDAAYRQLTYNGQPLDPLPRLNHPTA